MEINGFRGEYSFLSNMHYCKVEYKGITYPSSENAYQAQKSDNPEWLNYCISCSPKESKKYAPKNKEIPNNPKFGHILLRNDWNEAKRDIMKEICYNKFTQNPDLRKMLMATKNYYIEETNTWHDYYWGVCNGQGENNLGQILMVIRRLLRIESINVVNKRTHTKTENDFYIGRGSILGNPFTHKENTKADFIVPSRDEAVEKYREYIAEKLQNDKSFKDEMNKIWKKAMTGEGINLVCYCKPLSCHGDVIKELILDKI